MLAIIKLTNIFKYVEQIIRILMYIYICGHVRLTYMEYITRVCSLCEHLFNVHTYVHIYNIFMYIVTHIIYHISNIYIYHIKRHFSHN